MKRSIASWASLIIGFLAGSTGTGNAVVYCQCADYPANCVVRPSRQAMSLAESHLQLMLARAALLGRTYSIGITRTICDRIGPVHLLNRASSEK
jgi:hypothetical protein